MENNFEPMSIECTVSSYQAYQGRTKFTKQEGLNKFQKLNIIQNMKYVLNLRKLEINNKASSLDSILNTVFILLNKKEKTMREIMKYLR